MSGIKCAGGTQAQTKDHRQVHIVKQSCSGTSVAPIPSTQNTLSFASQSHEAIIILGGFLGNDVLL